MISNRVYDIGDKVGILIEKQEYASKILRITDDDSLVIYVPSLNGKNIVLEDDVEYTMIFYIRNELLKARIMLSDVYSEDGMEVIEVELHSDLERYQRREYFRIDYYCNIEYKILEICNDNGEREKLEGEWIKAKLVNISGGGMKFNSDEGIPSTQRVYLRFALGEGNNRNYYNCLANVVMISKKEKAKVFYEYRVSFSDIDEFERESIVKFVFEEERKKRRKRG